ncbi:flippase-like domain-containing protein [Aestuariibaculum sp. M13]|uniref:flippase-like domain-containing protein n=1 Tax=Aestuariibaculum sp. M13 TaxID=2967132 RepID=UPI002159D0C0|nr:flippase-like domain-containing protein [Aestuariibaculum sp. M13]MCR8666867.1 flippase-like domain-containing protein [Aestuariibaculum sp. M13]
MYALPYKTKQFFFVLIKLSLVIAAFCFIYFKLSTNNTLVFSKFLELTSKPELISWKPITFLLLLTTLNWLLEILKWQTLIKPLKPISFFEATTQSLGSLTVSLFTPNRIGEYGAKALFYNKTEISKIVSINGLHNLLQLIATLIFGIAGLLFFSKNFHLELNHTKLSMGVLVFTSLILSACFLLYKTDLKKNIRINKLLNFIQTYPKSKIGLSFCFSITRYLVFSFQFYFLLLTLNTDISYLNAMMGISSMYLLASVIPSIAIFDFAIKGSIAVYLFSFLSIDPIIIIYTTTIMWLLNFALPSLIGSYFVLNFKWPKSPVSA